MSTHASTASVRRVVGSINSFCLRFGYEFRKTIDAEEDRTNYYITPLAVHTLLAVLYEVAEGTSAAEVDIALKLRKDEIENVIYKAILELLLDGNLITKVYVATKVFLRETYLVNRSLTRTLADIFITDFETCLFTPASDTVITINRWVDRRTVSHVSNLVEPSDFDRSTRMIFVSAGCFKAKWLYDFRKETTKEHSFEVTPEETVSVQMMSLTAYFPYICHGDLGSHIVKLPFKEQKFCMLIFLPTARDGILHVEKQLQSVDMTDLVESMSDVDSVSLMLPKFRFENKLDFQETLAKFSITQAFNRSRDFAKLCNDDQPIYLTRMFQKTGISVNENGVSSYQKENDDESLRNMPPKIQIPKTVVNVNRPFMYVILGKIRESYITIFTGCVYNPTIEK